MSTDLWLSCVLVLGQIDPWDGAKWSEELLQVCLTGVLGQIGNTNSGIVIRCQIKAYIVVYFREYSCCCTSIQSLNRASRYNNSHPPLRLGCMDSPLRVPPSLRLGGTYFPVLLCAGCTGSGSAGERRKKGYISQDNLGTTNHQV